VVWGLCERALCRQHKGLCGGGDSPTGVTPPPPPHTHHSLAAAPALHFSVLSSMCWWAVNGVATIPKKFVTIRCPRWGGGGSFQEGGVCVSVGVVFSGVPTQTDTTPTDTHTLPLPPLPSF